MAINLPPEIRYELEAIVAELKLPVWMRPIDSRDWHVTVLFLGEQNEGDVEKVKTAIREVFIVIGAPAINLQKITYGPAGGEARMVWAKANGETSQDLGVLQNRISNSLRKHRVNFKIDYPDFNGHITLAKFEPGKRLSPLDESLNLIFRAETLDLMESNLTNGGSGYEILEKFKFKVE